jgi:hypothetical protein
MLSALAKYVINRLMHANLALECRIESTERGIPMWSGGYSNYILTFNRVSYYKEKYLVELNMQQMLYNLTILDFNEHDVNVLYTCRNLKLVEEI